MTPIQVFKGTRSLCCCGIALGFAIGFITEGRRKKEEGRRKKEEGPSTTLRNRFRKKEEGRRPFDYAQEPLQEEGRKKKALRLRSGTASGRGNKEEVSYEIKPIF
jgi:hypothetical protein